jgi:hypothetical protein
VLEVVAFSKEARVSGRELFLRKLNGRRVVLVTSRRNGFDHPHRVGRLAILPVDHEHAFGLHLLIKGSGGRDFSIILRLHLELEPDLDCVGVVLAQTSSRKGKDLPIAWVEKPRNAGARKLLRISSAIQKPISIPLSMT